MTAVSSRVELSLTTPLVTSSTCSILARIICMTGMRPSLITIVTSTSASYASISSSFLTFWLRSLIKTETTIMSLGSLNNHAYVWTDGARNLSIFPEPEDGVVFTRVDQELVCSSRGNPEPEIIWQSGDYVINGSVLLVTTKLKAVSTTAQPLTNMVQAVWKYRLSSKVCFN